MEKNMEIEWNLWLYAEFLLGKFFLHAHSNPLELMSVPSSNCRHGKVFRPDIKPKVLQSFL